MKRQNGFFWVCLAGTVLLAIGVVFLPRYFSRSLDMRSIGQVEVTGRDGFSFLEAGSNDVPGAARAFQYLEKSGENPMLITSMEEPSQIDRELAEKVYYEASVISDWGMVPWLQIEQGYQEVYDGKIPLYMDWSEHVKFARYYSLTYESPENPNKKEMMNLWYLRFSDNENFDYYFIVNAITCQIYYAEIYNLYSEDMIRSIYAENAYTDRTKYVTELHTRETELGYMFMDACVNYYEAYGSEYISQAGLSTLNKKMGIVILYFPGAEEPDTNQHVYIEIKVNEEPHLGAYRGFSIGCQDLAGWVRSLQEQF